MRTASDAVSFFSMNPRNDLLLNRATNQAYCRANEGDSYLVYFTNGGMVDLEIASTFSLQWVSLDKEEQRTAEVKPMKGRLALNCPDEGNWIAVLRKQ